MARFRRRGFKRRRIGRRRSFRRRRLFRRGFRRQLTRIGIGRPERKFQDTYFPSTSIGVAATGLTPTILTGIAEGSDNDERIGRRVLLTNLQMRLLFTGTPVAQAVDNSSTASIRLLIVRDSQFTGANVPTLGDVLGTTVVTSAFFAWNDLQTQGSSRFRTMVDKYMNVYMGNIYPATTPTTSDIGSNQRRMWKYFKKMRRELFFNGPTNVSTDAGRNVIWMFLMALDPPGLGAVTYQGAVRIRYTDV